VTESADFQDIYTLAWSETWGCFLHVFKKKVHVWQPLASFATVDLEILLGEVCPQPP